MKISIRNLLNENFLHSRNWYPTLSSGGYGSCVFVRLRECIFLIWKCITWLKGISMSIETLFCLSAISFDWMVYLSPWKQKYKIVSCKTIIHKGGQYIEKIELEIEFLLRKRWKSTTLTLMITSGLPSKGEGSSEAFFKVYLMLYDNFPGYAPACETLITN